MKVAAAAAARPNWKALRAAALPWLVLAGMACYMAFLLFVPFKVQVAVLVPVGAVTVLGALGWMSRHLYRESLRKQRVVEQAAQDSAEEPY